MTRLIAACAGACAFLMSVGAGPAQDPQADAEARQIRITLLMKGLDADAAWTRIFAANKRAYKAPAVVAFTAPVDSGGCGQAGRGDFGYCRASHTIVYDAYLLAAMDKFGRQATGGTLSAIVGLQHEIGHGVLNQLGHRFLLSADEENAADCLSGAATREIKSQRAVTPADLESARWIMRQVADPRISGLERMVDPNAHGSADDRVRQFDWGYEKGYDVCAFRSVAGQMFPPIR